MPIPNAFNAISPRRHVGVEDFTESWAVDLKSDAVGPAFRDALAPEPLDVIGVFDEVGRLGGMSGVQNELRVLGAVDRVGAVHRTKAIRTNEDKRVIRYLQVATAQQYRPDQ